MGTLIDVQTKIFETLSEDQVLGALGVTVFDNIPDNQRPYPFVQVGDDEFDDWGAHDIDGFKVGITIHTWSQAEGRKECKQIQDKIYDILHELDLELDDQVTVSMRSGLITTMIDPDGRTYHGVNKFNLILGG